MIPIPERRKRFIRQKMSDGKETESEVTGERGEKQKEKEKVTEAWVFILSRAEL